MAILQKKRAKAVGVKIIDKLDTSYDVVVDALFGSGLNRPLDKKNQDLITILNKMDAYKLSCDIPSGLNLDNEAFIADKTITMGAHKEALYHDGAKDFVGEIVCVDLGVGASLYENESNTYLLEKKDMQLPHRLLQNTHKGHFGHLAVISGEKQGAAVLAAKAATAFGAGLVSVVGTLPSNLPHDIMSAETLPQNTTAICIGMGLGKYYDDTYLSPHVPLLIDADMFYNPIMIEILKRENIVLTPHPKEFISLLKMTDIADISIETLQKERFIYTRMFAQKYPKTTLLLKGANTLIAQNNQLYIQPFGTNALSKGGSGDVLTGLIASLLAQGYTPLNGAITGSLAHAFSAKNFDKNAYALSPDDLIKGVTCL